MMKEVVVTVNKVSVQVLPIGLRQKLHANKDLEFPFKLIKYYRGTAKVLLK